MNDLQKRTWAEINLENLRHNYRAIRATLPDGCRFLGVVKADAYGHGALPVSRLLQAEGADYLAVSCLDEALELRGGGVTMPILILGHTPHEYTSVLIEQNITQTVTCLAKALEYSAEAVSLGKTLKIHIKLDTGMSRLGFLCDGAHFEEGVDNVIRPARCRASRARACIRTSPCPTSRARLREVYTRSIRVVLPRRGRGRDPRQYQIQNTPLRQQRRRGELP